MVVVDSYNVLSIIRVSNYYNNMLHSYIDNHNLFIDLLKLFLIRHVLSKRNQSHVQLS